MDGIYVMVQINAPLLTALCKQESCVCASKRVSNAMGILTAEKNVHLQVQLDGIHGWCDQFMPVCVCV